MPAAFTPVWRATEPSDRYAGSFRHDVAALRFKTTRVDVARDCAWLAAGAAIHRAVAEVTLVTSEQIESLDDVERAALMRHLVEMQLPPLERYAARRRFGRAVRGVVTIGAVVLVPWALYLALSLPRRTSLAMALLVELPLVQSLVEASVERDRP